MLPPYSRYNQTTRPPLFIYTHCYIAHLVVYPIISNYVLITRFLFFHFRMPRWVILFFMSQICTPFRIAQKAKRKRALQAIVNRQTFAAKRPTIHVRFAQATFNTLIPWWHVATKSIDRCNRLYFVKRRLNHLGERGFSQNFLFIFLATISSFHTLVTSYHFHVVQWLFVSSWPNHLVNDHCMLKRFSNQSL